MVDTPDVIWILLVVLTVVGGVAAVGIAAGDKRKQLAAPQQKALGAGDNAIERTVRDVRVADVLTIDGRDFLCEGQIDYDEDGHRWRAARVVDGADVRWLVVGIERTGTTALRLTTQDESQPITGYPPEVIVMGDVRYMLDKRGTATCELRGDVGPLGDLKKDRPEAHVERCRWWLYSAPGEDTLIVEQWGADYRVLRGKKIVEGTIDLIPGS